MRSVPRWMVVTLASAILAVAAAGWWFDYAQRMTLKREAEQDLSATLQLKVRQVVEWRQNRLAEATVGMESPFLAEALASWLRDGNTGEAEKILVRLESGRNAHQYLDVLVADARGHILLSVAGKQGELHPDALATLQQAVQTRRPMMTDLHGGPGDFPPHVDVLAPLAVKTPSGLQTAIVLQSDASQALYPLLQSWPRPSQSAETLIVRRDGDEVLFLSESRSQPGVALNLRIPVSRAGAPAVMAVLGQAGTGEGRDYRGVDVLFAAGAIPDTPWFAVAKTDREEVLAPLRQRELEAAGFAAVALTAFALAIGLAWRQHAARALERELQAAREQKALTERIAYLSTHANDIMLFMNEEWRILEVNDRAVSAYGYSRDELLQLTYRELRAPEDREAFNQEARKTDTQNGSVVERVHQRNDGARLPVESSLRAVDIDGKLFHQAIIRDITERKHAEAELVQSEDRMRFALETSRIGAWDLSLVDHTAYRSLDHDRIFGYDALLPEWTYEMFLEHVVPEDRADVDAKFRNSVETHGDWSFKCRIRRTDGDIRWIWAAGRHRCNDRGALDRIAGIVQDITEQKQAEATLRESEAQLRRVTEAAHVGLYEWNVTRDQAYWSPEVYRLFGLKPGSPSGLASWLSCLDPADRERAGRVVQAGLEGARSTAALGRRSDVYRVVHEDGSAHWLEATGQYEMTEGELILRGAVRDVTDRKHVEEALAQERENLERRVRERTAQLEHANKELESFSYSVSHDLRAPLRAIDGFSRILVDEYGSRLDDEGHRICSVIRQNTEHMGCLIDNLLAFSRLDRTAVNPSAVDMHALAQSTFDQLATSDGHERITFELGALPPAYADPVLIRQVWVNLLENAVKFSSKREQAVIEVAGECAGDENVYSVRDNGAGFDMQYAAKLFGVFQRLHSPRDFKGTGVGLALVQRVIHRHGGRIWAESEPDRGAVFRFTIPQKGASEWSQEQ